MPSIFGFRMLQGKRSASGHLRTGDDAIQVQCRGLIPGENYHLYRHRTHLATRTADHQGQLSFTTAGDGFFFLCDHTLRPVLWETGEDGPSGYYRALTLLPKPAPERSEPPKEVFAAGTEKNSHINEHCPDEMQRTDAPNRTDEETLPSSAIAVPEETETAGKGNDFPSDKPSPNEAERADAPSRTDEGTLPSSAIAVPEEAETAGKGNDSPPDKPSPDEAERANANSRTDEGTLPSSAIAAPEETETAGKVIVSLLVKPSPDEVERADAPGRTDEETLPSSPIAVPEETETAGKGNVSPPDKPSPDEVERADAPGRTDEGTLPSSAMAVPEETETAGKVNDSLPDKPSPDEVQCSEQPIHANEKKASFSGSTADMACRTETLSAHYRLHAGQYRIPCAALRSAASPSLRAPSAGPLACSLPAVQWPDSLLHISSVLHCGQPFSNLGHPGFRCVKLPCPNPSFPYCIVGYRTSSSRISALLYALPGHPMLPPRGFADCRFQQNHWLRIQSLG